MPRLLFAAVVTALFVGCGGGGDEAQEQPGKEQPVIQGDPEAGAARFDMQGCKNCHTFQAAGSTRNVGPNLDEVAKRYDAAFIRESITDPQAYVETGSGGSIGGNRKYRALMPTFGPDADTDENRISEQEVADLVAFLTQSR